MYLRARDYDPATSQFLTVDPAVSVTHRPYAYVANNPLLTSDPRGLWSLDEGLDWLAVGLMRGPGANVASFVEGFGDAASFGLSGAIRNALSPGSECFVNKDGFYFGGEVTGIVASVATGTAAVGLAGRAALGAGKLLSAAQAAKLPFLTGSIAESFAASQYSREIVQAGTILYRATSSDGKIGQFFGTVGARTSAEAEVLYNLKLWGNPAEMQTVFRVASDTAAYVGRVAGGSGVQVLLPKLPEIGADLIKLSERLLP